MVPVEHRIRRQINQAWDDIHHNITKMWSSSEIRPLSADAVFCIARAGDDVKIDIKPFVFKVPEKPFSGRELFIVISGKLSFDIPEDGNSVFKTNGFSTRIGYFRQKKVSLKHVYGAHYDFEENTFGHPVFHAQLCSLIDFISVIGDQFNFIPENAGQFCGFLKNVRTPTAQMDVFSAITQVCADHMIPPQPALEVRTAFSSIKSACEFYVGAAHKLPHLKCDSRLNCYRSKHWYAAPSPPTHP